MKQCLANLIATLMLCLPILVGAQEGESKSIPADEIANYLGEWSLTVKSPRGESKGHLSIRQTSEGLSVGSIKTRENQEAREIESFKKVPGALELRYTIEIQGNSLPMIATVKREASKMTGQIADEGGRFTMDIAGDLDIDPIGRAGGASTAAEGEESGDAEVSEQATSRRRRGFGGRAALKIGDHEINALSGSVSTDGDEDETIESLKDGGVALFKTSLAMKLRTPVDLNFNGTTIKAGNQGENYPGVYSMWLKRAGNGWRLVFNNEADVWGTMHNPASDAAEIPLTHEKLSEPVENLKIELKEAAGGGELRITFGQNAWSANFRVN